LPITLDVLVSAAVTDFTEELAQGANGTELDILVQLPIANCGLCLVDCVAVKFRRTTTCTKSENNVRGTENLKLHRIQRIEGRTCSRSCNSNRRCLNAAKTRGKEHNGYERTGGFQHGENDNTEANDSP
jgi:hypothetical protein